MSRSRIASENGNGEKDSETQRPGFSVCVVSPSFVSDRNDSSACPSGFTEPSAIPSSHVSKSPSSFTTFRINRLFSFSPHASFSSFVTRDVSSSEIFSKVVSKTSGSFVWPPARAPARDATRSAICGENPNARQSASRSVRGGRDLLSVLEEEACGSGDSEIAEIELASPVASAASKASNDVATRSRKRLRSYGWFPNIIRPASSSLTGRNRVSIVSFLSSNTKLPCAYSSKTNACFVSPAPNTNSTARSAPSCFTSFRRFPRRCIRSFALSLLGVSALRSRAYDVEWNRDPDSSRTTVFSPSPLSVRPPLLVNLSRNVLLSSRS